MPLGKRKRPAFRISIRLLLALIFAASVPLSFVAVHFQRLGRQTEAREFLVENHCQTFPGAIEEMKAARVRSVSSFHKPDCWLFVQTINPTTSATQQSGMLNNILVPTFITRIRWYGSDSMLLSMISNS